MIVEIEHKPHTHRLAVSYSLENGQESHRIETIVVINKNGAYQIILLRQPPWVPNDKQGSLSLLLYLCLCLLLHHHIVFRLTIFRLHHKTRMLIFPPS